MAKQVQSIDPPEHALLEPVLALFSSRRYRHAVEVPLGWRKIDLVCVEKKSAGWLAIELKVRDWRGALYQAAINQQLADKSYVAMWSRHVPNALKHRPLFEQYRVGLIAVSSDGAHIVFDFAAEPSTLLKRRQRELVVNKLEKMAMTRKGPNEAISLLPA